MKRSCLLAVLSLASALSVAQAQSLSFDQTNCRTDSTRRVNGRAEFRFALFPSSTGASSLSRPFGYSLMDAGSGSTARTLGLSPMAAESNLQVLGGGTVSRLTKWTGLTSSNSFIGNSTIFEDKNGLVGIGRDTPTSKLTAVGTIESTSGGFKFPCRCGLDKRCQVILDSSGQVVEKACDQTIA